jgi:beta-aspartyl-peptidase (threonine type)
MNAVFILVIVITALPRQTRAEEEKQIRSLLDAQAMAWNMGDLDGFMQGYWKSEKLTFISGGTLTRGWEPTRQRYVKRYQTEGKDKMGVLTFDEIEIELLCSDAATVRGRFELVRGERKDWGRYTLILRKFPEGWRIVHDHTSVSEPQPKQEVKK